ncbi:hypothetical protein HYX70_01695 [Candidatus Saccharibacteria bacterium]|nr:hypothetical protein [Candidatus Saccharibacteria bacterium]
MKKYYFSESQKIVLLSILSALLLAVPFLSYNYGWLILISFAPYLLLLQAIASKKLSLAKKIFWGWLPGLASMMIVVGWLLFSDRSQLQLNQAFSLFMLALVYGLLVLILSLQYVVFSWLYFRCIKNPLNPWVFLLIPAFWVVAEFSRSVLLSLVTIGSGGSVGPYWNFGNLGFALAVTPLGFAARIVGLWGMSFAAVAISLAWIWLFKKKFLWPVIIFAAVLVITMIGYFGWKTTSSSLSLGYLQYGLPLVDHQQLRAVWQKATTEAINQGANTEKPSDVLVLPEYSGIIGSSLLTPKAAQALLAPVLKNNGVVITTTEDRSVVPRKNVLIAANQNANIIGRQDKAFLIPIGEYLPYILEVVLRAGGQSSFVAKQRNNLYVAKGAANGMPLLVNNLKIAAQACSGAIAPELFRQQVRQGGNVMTNPASPAGLLKATVYHEQSLQTARFMAMANARPYAQGAFGTYSFILNKDGSVEKINQDFGFAYKSATVGVPGRRTLYTILGEWVVVLSFIFTAAYFAYYIKRKKFDN